MLVGLHGSLYLLVDDVTRRQTVDWRSLIVLKRSSCVERFVGDQIREAGKSGWSPSRGCRKTDIR